MSKETETCPEFSMPLESGFSAIPVHERYLAFAGSTYYPSGGAFDLQGVYSTSDGAVADMKRQAEPKSFDWWHVINCRGEIVAKWKSGVYAHGAGD